MKVFCKRSLIFVGVLLLSGCNQLPVKSNSASTPVPVNPTHSPLSAEISAQLSERSGYAVVQIASSSWGDNVQMDLAPVYFSATGCVCREGRETQLGSALKDDIIACQYGNYWGYHRNVTKSLGQQ